MFLVPESGDPDDSTARQPAGRAWPLPIRRLLQLLVLVTLLPLAGLVAWAWFDDAPGSPRVLMTLTSLAALPLAWLLAGAIARSIERPLSAIAAVTNAVAAGDRSVRVATAGAPEIESVGRQLNHMLDLRSRAEAACGGGDAVDAVGARARALSHTVTALADAPPDIAGSVQCTNLRIGAVTVDNVEVPPGAACQLDGTTVTGSVKALTDATLIVGNGAQVAGSIVGDAAHHVELTGATSRVGGNFEVKKGGSATLASAEVAGTAVFEEMTGTVSVGGARAGGGMKVVKNTGATTVANNTVIGALQCFDNAPAPLVGGNSADALEGQCFQASSPPPPTPPSGNVTCVGLSLVGLNLDSVIIPDNASCTLIGSTMNGTVQLGNNARLVAQDLNITGNLIADGAAEVSISGASRVGGSVQLNGGAAASISGVNIGGSLQIDAMPGAVTASGNQIGGNTQVIANLGGTMAGVLQCLGNQPAPTGSGNVAAQKEGQCTGL